MPAKASKKSKSLKKSTASKSTPVKPFFSEPMHLLIIGGAIIVFALFVSSFMTYGANVRW
jgi:hypothetical protein